MATSGMVTAALLQLPQQLPLQVLLLLLLGATHKALHLPLHFTSTPNKHLHASYAALSVDSKVVEIHLTSYC